MTNEQKLVGAIIRADWSSNARRTWDPALFHDIDWSRIPNIAWQHKIRPMMAATLREAGWPGVPAAARSAVESAEQMCSQRAMRQLPLLRSIIAASEAKGIRVIATKGIPLSFKFYNDPFIREAFDLDLLVHSDDRADFEELLGSQGCVPTQQGPPLTALQAGILRRFHHDKRFIHAESGVFVESHHKLERNSHLIETDFDSLWRAHVRVGLGGGTVAILGQNDLIHYLGIHAARAGWVRWKWIADMVALLRDASERELDEAREWASREGNQNLFDSWIVLLERVAGLSLPRTCVQRAERNRRARALAGAALRMSCRTETPASVTEHRFVRAQIAQSFRTKYTLQYQAEELLALLHRDEDWHRMRLPDWLIWYYYLNRPLSYLLRRGETLLGVGTKTNPPN